MNIALFDLDNTLISGDSDHEWGNFLVDNNYVDPISYKEKNNMFFEQYKNGLYVLENLPNFHINH
jgi:FMN phosphatase YigB (HAD superfamily)